MATANLSNVVVAVDGSKESMKALRWAPAPRQCAHHDGVDESRANMKQNMLMKLRSSKVPAEALELLERSEDAPVTLLRFRAPLSLFFAGISKGNVCVAGGGEDTGGGGGSQGEDLRGDTELKVDLLVMGCRAFGPIKRHETV
ncbi:hypothetical protein ZWY2020_029760 [Hordeum vulgare]|nr:hypothetical protein ZWY2020_029760 [Hordeum vulgare]